MLPSQKPESVNLKRFLPDIALFRRTKHRVAKITGQLPLLQTQKQVIVEAETQRFRLAATEWARKSKKFGLILAGLGGLSLALAVVKGGQIAQANSEITRRKEQLSQPVHDLSASEATNFPWTHGNLNEWLYRPVKITGRPLHNKAMLVPRYKEGYWGFDYIVPLVTKENEDGSVQEGILLNKGWMPHEYESTGARWRIENSLPQTFECYVSLNSELDANGSFFKEGNSLNGRRNRWGHVYLPDMAEKSGFRNKDAVKTALLECVVPNSPLDERNPQHHQLTLVVSEDYPYPKTRAGALQLRKMPWELRAEQNTYMTAGIILSGLAGVARFLV